MNQIATPPAPPPVPRRLGTGITIFLLAFAATHLLVRGYSFYKLGVADRPGHPDYRTLSPSGFLGHGYGIVGTALIFTNLLYLLRHKFAKYISDRLGTVKSWLNVHAFTGLLGSLLIVFHSAFQFRTAIAAVTSASLAIVVVTGLIGFYLHALMPRAGLKPFKERLAEVELLMPGFASHIDEFVKRAPVTTLRHDASLLRTLLTIPCWMLQARARRRGIRPAARADKLFRVLERNQPELARDLVLELGELAAKEVDTNAGAAMMRSWRSLHRFLAIMMLVSVSVHIGVAWYYGFRWIFGR
jgi:hypothetical protein